MSKKHKRTLLRLNKKQNMQNKNFLPLKSRVNPLGNVRYHLKVRIIFKLAKSSRQLPRNSPRQYKSRLVTFA